MQNTIKDFNFFFKNTLKNVYSNNELQQLLFEVYSHVMNLSKTDILSAPEKKIPLYELNELKKITNRLLNNEPLQYITGETEFFGLPFHVNKHVLIPRQETEELVDTIIKADLPNNPAILDIGTGSGCIAISLAKNITPSQVTAIDFSENAISVAKQNAKNNKTNIKFILKDILQTESDNFDKKYNIIVSNPPYVRESEKQLMHSNVLDYEPHSALFVPDTNALIFYKKIAALGKEILKKNGLLFFEINEALGTQVQELLQKLKYCKIIIIKDLSGKDRFVKASR